MLCCHVINILLFFDRLVSKKADRYFLKNFFLLFLLKLYWKTMYYILLAIHICWHSRRLRCVHNLSYLVKPDQILPIDTLPYCQYFQLTWKEQTLLLGFWIQILWTNKYIFEINFKNMNYFQPWKINFRNNSKFKPAIELSHLTF